MPLPPGESLSFVPPMLPPLLPPSSLHAPPLPLPGSSIVKAGFSSRSSSLSCRMQPRSASYPAKPAPNAAQHPVLGSGEGRGREKGKGKRFKPQIQPTRQGRAESERTLTPIDLFLRSRKNTLILSVPALVCLPTQPLIYFRKQQTCWWWWGGGCLRCNFSDQPSAQRRKATCRNRIRIAALALRHICKAYSTSAHLKHIKRKRRKKCHGYRAALYDYKMLYITDDCSHRMGGTLSYCTIS